MACNGKVGIGEEDGGMDGGGMKINYFFVTQFTDSVCPRFTDKKMSIVIYGQIVSGRHWTDSLSTLRGQRFLARYKTKVNNIRDTLSVSTLPI